MLTSSNQDVARRRNLHLCPRCEPEHSFRSGGLVNLVCYGNGQGMARLDAYTIFVIYWPHCNLALPVPCSNRCDIAWQ